MQDKNTEYLSRIMNEQPLITSIEQIRLSLPELDQFINSLPTLDDLGQREIGGFLRQIEPGDWRVYLRLVNGNILLIGTVLSRKVRDRSSLFFYVPSVLEMINTVVDYDSTLPNIELIKKMADILRERLVHAGLLDRESRLKKPDSGHFSYPQEKRQSIVEEYWRALKAGDIIKKEAWAESNYGISARTLNNYLKEFPMKK